MLRVRSARRSPSRSACVRVSRRSLRMSWRALRTASAVTAQVFTTTAFCRPACRPVPSSPRFRRRSGGSRGLKIWARSCRLHKAVRQLPKTHASLGRSSRRHRRASQCAACRRPDQCAQCALSGRACRRNSRGAGRGPRRQRDANAAFPHPHADVIGADDLRELHVGAFGIKRVMFNAAPKAARSIARHHRRRTCSAGCPCPSPSVRRRWASLACPSLGQRDVRPVKLRMPHVDRCEPLPDPQRARSRDLWSGVDSQPLSSIK